MTPPLLPLYLLLFCFTGLYFAYLYGRRTKQFRWGEYVAMMSTPVVACLGLSYYYGVHIVYLFAASCVVGFVLEYSIGFIYHKILNRRLWTYGRYSVGGYTSLLTFPMWGVAGVVFWLLAHSIGL